MEPVAGEVEAKVGVDELPGAGGLSIAAILKQGDQSIYRTIKMLHVPHYSNGVLHVGDGGGELREVELRAVDDGEG